MSQEPKPSVESIAALSGELKETFLQMSQAVGQIRESFNKLPFMVRPFVERDFSSEMGFELPEWQDFLSRLATRLEKIRDAAGGIKDSDKAAESLSEAAKPFLERCELAVEKLKTFEKYTAESPSKIERAPKMFVSDEAREQLKRAPEYAPQIGEAAKGLQKLRSVLIGYLATS